MAGMVCDFRSDTATLPMPAMQEVIATAKLGDAARGDDPAGNELEAIAARLTDKEGALFLSWGALANLSAVMAHHCRSGEVIVEADAHIYNYEGGGLSVVAGAIARPVAGRYGVMDIAVADLGARVAAEAVRPGISEHAVSAEAVHAMSKGGSEFEPIIPLVASEINMSIFERVAAEKIIASGGTVINDIGAVVRGYTGDVGCTVISDTPNAEQKAINKATRLALEEAKEIVKSGVALSDIDARAREVITEEGWSRCLYSGNTGHQLGFALHGEPVVHKGVETRAVENMVMCPEPRIVLPDRPDIGGAYLEDVALVTANGFEQLNNTPPGERLLA